MRRHFHRLWRHTTRTWLAFALMLPLACAEDEDRAANLDEGSGGASSTADPCASPNDGCPCDDLGQVDDCGTMTVVVDGYKICFDASRTCGEDGTWGACLPVE